MMGVLDTRKSANTSGPGPSHQLVLHQLPAPLPAPGPMDSSLTASFKYIMTICLLACLFQNSVNSLQASYSSRYLQLRARDLVTAH